MTNLPTFKLGALVSIVGLFAVLNGDAVGGPVPGGTADWNHIAAACTPDADTTPLRYQTSDGAVAFKGRQAGLIQFRCNVVSPLDAFDGDQPTWDSLVLLFSDNDLQGHVGAVLYRQAKAGPRPGLLTQMTYFESADGEGVRRESVPIKGDFDFERYAYFVRLWLFHEPGYGVSPLSISVVSLEDLL